MEYDSLEMLGLGEKDYQNCDTRITHQLRREVRGDIMVPPFSLSLAHVNDSTLYIKLEEPGAIQSGDIAIPPLSLFLTPQLIYTILCMHTKYSILVQQM